MIGMFVTYRLVGPPLEDDNLFTKNITAEFILSPICFVLRGFLVVGATKL